MKIISALVENFGSYDRLEFKFNDQGLTLVSGPTGAGKSTLCDIIPWVLFGVTSKNGAVEEIKSWGQDQTEGTIYLDNAHINSITRIRSKKSSDLYYENMSLGRQRGKDINDTQSIINSLLGVDADSYLSGAYLHEFSQTANFFTTTAKNRRELTEQLANLSLSVQLIENISVYKKEVKKEKEQLETQLAVIKGKLEQTRDMIQNAKSKAKMWQTDQDNKIQKLKEQHATFESNKKAKIKKITKEFDNFEEAQEFQRIDFTTKIERLMSEILPKAYFEENKINTEILIDKCDKEKCTECGNSLKSDKKIFYMKQLNDWKNQETSNNQKLTELKLAKATLKLLEGKTNPYKEQIEEELIRENTYEDQIAAVKLERNPFTLIAEEHTSTNKELQEKLASNQGDITSFKVELNDLEVLSTVIDDFRGVLIGNTVVNLQNNTNKLLSDYFDAEIRVGFTVENADKLTVSITKDGNTCTFSQLSKGQRQLLKLCFGVSVMKAVSNHNGTNFNTIFLDEPFDGMDEGLKIKGFRLLERLSTEYESVFVIDHSEALKSMFSKRYDVTLDNGNSRIEEG